MDGKDGISEASLSCSPGSLTISCDTDGKVKDAVSATLALAWTMAVGGSAATVTNVVVKQKSVYVGVTKNSNTSFSLSIPKSLTKVELDKGITFTVTGTRDEKTYTKDYFFALIPANAGPQGDETPVYSLVCSPATINFRGNAVGEFAPETALVKVRVRKVMPSGSTELTPANNVLDGKYYLYYFDQDAGVWYAATNGNAYYEHSVSAEDALSGLITAVPYVLSTSATANNTANGITDANTVARMDVTVVCDGRRGAQGPTGATGKFFFPMGEWDPSVTYTRTGDLLPLVFLTDMNSYNEATGTYGDYWYLGRAESDTGTRPASSANNPWVKANSFGLVITQGIFAEFAKLGKGIFSGDYLFSMNGRIGSTEYLAGATVGDTGRPAYLWFKGDTGASYHVSNLSQSSTTSTTSGAPTPLVEDIVLMKGMSISIRLNIMSSYGTTRIGIRASGASTFLTYQEWTQSSGYSVKTITYTATTNMVIGIYMYTTGNVAVCKGEGSYSFSGVFEPNWWVDLLTGKMSAARGNFVVDGSGNVLVNGTVKATNLFRTTALCWGGVQCCLLNTGGTTTTYLYVRALNRTASPALATKYGFKVGDYVPYTDAMKNGDDAGDFEDGMNNVNYSDNDFIPCTYSADIIELLDKPSSGTLWPSNGKVYLPLPADFAGKMVEVRHNMTTSNNTASVRVANNATLISLYPELNQNGVLVVGGNSLTDQATINAGSVAAFYSTGTYWVAYGVV